ncbi:helix-turn-helix transcriptional regulator [Aminobacter sp. MDW-2]|uniref:helix-turn-helix domain-containing protein n=1 Tax=Aminobacter sp. MDW-2 TaxID=2666139 RepID=UPI0012B13718|nr:helix-turn-helix transcriptional regulator [Aminobacter sp. MDW-2]MRX33363.1 helix-turn-helix domain-containing protein [Aminobacter sp. MDW-2]QNH33575.1 helix-turn-helix transcriptional regulator [Aminobacter sp. MDW-2]
MDTKADTIGGLIREWRTRRRMSQLDLAMEAEISQRHLSFIESGRSVPSREMVQHISEQLEIPLRQRNQLLLAAGYAPSFSEKPLDDPSLAPAMDAVRMVLKGHEPYPAIAIDRHWNLIEGNAALGQLLEGVEDASLLEPPVNVLRLSLHPRGVAPRIVNLHEWRAHLIARLKHQNDTSGDPVLKALEQELLGYPDGQRQGRPIQGNANAIVHPLRIRVGDAVLSFISTTTVFGTPLDVTLSEIAIESFFPADEETAALLSAR